MCSCFGFRTINRFAFLLFFGFVFAQVALKEEKPEVNECCPMTEMDIDDTTEMKTAKKSPKAVKQTRSKVKVEIQLSDEEKHEIFDTVYDDIYEVVLPNTLWGEIFLLSSRIVCT